MISNIKELIEIYYLVNDRNSISHLLLHLCQMSDKRARYMMKSIENDVIFIKLKNLSDLNIKKTRKTILLTPNVKDEITEFNNKLKETTDSRFIQNFHNIEYWLTNIISNIMYCASDLVREIENSAGYYHYIEKTRLDLDERIRYNTALKFTITDQNTEPEWTSKTSCLCKKKLKGHFKINKRYDYRVSNITNDIIVYVNEHFNLIFEEDSFQDYFIDRVDIINSILN